jgi:chromosome segregation ATPase
MAMWVCALLLPSLVDAATLKANVSPVQKVIELLDGLKAKVEGDLAAEELMMEEFTKFCDSESNTKEDAITSAQRTINDLSATIEDSTGSISELNSETDSLASKISTTDAELAEATKIRNDERAAFEASEKELSETIDTLSRAIVVLKRGQTGFMQAKGANKELETLADTLSKIVSASWVSTDQKVKVQALLQSEDEDLSLQPQATTAAYASKGGGILDALADLKEKAEESLSSARKTEMEASHAYEMLKQSLEMESSQMNKRMGEATNQRSSTEEAKHMASEELTETEASLKTDTAYLADLKQSCAAKATEWSERQKSAAEEVSVIEKAKEILSSGVKVFLQVDKSANDADAMKREQVSKLLRDLAQENHVYALSQIASEAQAGGPFDKVIGMVEGMIDKLMKEAAEESDAKAFCDTEIEKSRAKQKELSSKADMHSVRIEKGAAAKAKLESQIKMLQEEVAAIDSANSEATALRSKENAEYTKASAEYKMSADAVANAIQTLQEYYSQGSFVQLKATAGPEFGGAKSDIGTTIIEMLEVAESDFTRLLAESEAGERTAQTAYDSLSQKDAVAKAAKLAEVKGKQGEVKSLEMNLLNYKEDKESTLKELDAVLTYLDKLKPQCQTKVMSYAERKARREQEIAGLKEALAILSE